jgi:hypothetical protein
MWRIVNKTILRITTLRLIATMSGFLLAEEGQNFLLPLATFGPAPDLPCLALLCPARELETGKFKTVGSISAEGMSNFSITIFIFYIHYKA